MYDFFKKLNREAKDLLNILFIAVDTSQQLHRIYYYLEKELARSVNLMIWRKPGHIDYILSKLPIKPDFILYLNDIGNQMEPSIHGLSNTDIPVGLFVNDVHRFIQLRKNYITKHKINYLFTVSRDQFIKIYPEFINKMEWFPHFVQTEIYHDYDMKRNINLLMIGAVNDLYPLRQKIVKAYEGDPSFVYRKHPGYRTFSKYEEDQYYIGDSYVKELNRAKIVFTSPSVFHYPVIKYFEVLSCKTLLLAPTFPELEDLGFIPDYHFVAIHEDNFMEKAAYFMDHEVERKQIAEQGYQFIRKNHSVQTRAEQLVKKIKHMIHD